MPISVVVGAALIGLSLPILWWSVAGAGPKAGGILGRFSKRGEATTDMRELALAEGAGRRVVAPALHGLAARLRRITPAGFVDAMERRIELAGIGGSWPIERLLTVQLLLIGGAIALGLAFVNAQGVRAGAIALGILLWLAMFGPYVVMDRKVRQRQGAIQKELPDAMDQITMAVEAGLGFEGALHRAASAGTGPLAEELRRVLKEMQIGVSRAQSLRRLAERTDLPDLQEFVVSVVQAEEHGLPIAQVLRVQASEMRTKRRQRAEEQAMRLPVKMIFPLGLCIFPALFIVIIGPGVVRIWRALAL